MKALVLEVRDEGTFVPVLAVDMNPDLELNDARRAQTFLLRRVGYPCDHKPNILLTRLAADGSPATNDPYWWGSRFGRTIAVAHLFILEHWAKLKDGDVVDVQFILGETQQPKASERHG